MGDELLSLPKAAHYLGLSAKSLRSLCEAGKVECYTPGPEGSHKRFRVSDLDNYLESTRVKVKPARMPWRVPRMMGRAGRWK